MTISEQVIQAVSESLEVPVDNIMQWGGKKSHAIARGVIVCILKKGYGFTSARACAVIDRGGSNATYYARAIRRNADKFTGFKRQLQEVCEKLNLKYEEVFGGR